MYRQESMRNMSETFTTAAVVSGKSGDREVWCALRKPSRALGRADGYSFTGSPPRALFTSASTSLMLRTASSAVTTVGFCPLVAHSMK